MKVKFAFWKIDEIRDNSEISNDIFARPVPSVIADVANMAELKDARARYIVKAEDSGFCGRILTYKEGRERAISGFNAFAEEKPLVNRGIGEATNVAQH